MVVGVTNEPDSLVSKDAVKKKMRFPIAMVSGEDFDRQYGVDGFPSAFLIDAQGFVAWSGHPGNFDDELITEALKDVDVIPPLAGDYEAINELLAQRAFGKAWAALGKHLVKNQEDAVAKAAQGAIATLLEKRLGEAKAKAEGNAYGEALGRYEEIARLFVGVPGAEAAKPAAETLLKNKEAKNELAAWDKLQEAMSTFRKGDLEKAVKSYASIAKKYQGTPSGTRAAELAALHPQN